MLRLTLRQVLLPALIVLVTVPAAPAAAGMKDPLTVFGASSLKDVLEELGQLYRDRNSREVRFSFAASSTLARQIEAGAPAQIFASASESWMDYLAERGLIAPGTRRSPIANRLVLVAPEDSPLERVEVGPAMDLDAMLPARARLAVGDPDHVPAGIYARQALIALGLWDEAEPRLARAADVRAAVALVARGEAPLGIVYATDAGISERVKVIGRFPGDSHPPIHYAFAIVAGQDTTAVRDLLDLMTGPLARPIYQRAGFSPS